MSVLFLSHSTRDKAEAERLRGALLELGFTEVFLDNHSILPGQKWEPVLYERLRACRAVVALYSQGFMESKWCFAELTHARALGRPIVPVRLEPCVIPAFLLDYQVEELGDLKPSALERIRKGLEAAGVRSNERPEWNSQRPPYPGLASFDVEDAGVYFGRQEDIQRGLDQLHDLAEFGGGSALLILGASGAGKSSLLRAGLVDRLRRDPRRWTVIGPLRPLREPLLQLSRALQLARTQRGLPAGELAAIREELRAPGDPLRALHGLSDPRHPEARFILVVDQLEELLSADNPERAEFLAWLERVLALPGRPVLLLGSLRSDHLAELEQAAPFAASTSKHLSIGPLDERGLLASITDPARLAGVSFEDDLAQEILADVRERHALPLLAFTLRALWDRRTPGERIRRHSYVHDLGRVHGAIRRAAEAASGGAPDAARWRLLRRALLKMVQVGPEGKLVRRRLPWSELPAGAEQPLGALVEARLLVRDGGSVEPAHEALFEAWTQLAEAVKEARDALIIRGELEADAARWKRQKRDPEFLWPRARLEQATGVLGAAELELEPVGQEFTAASWERVRRQEAEEAERKRRETRNLRALAVGLFIVVTVVSLLGLRARNERLRAESRELTTSALLNVREDPQRALLLLQEAIRRAVPERFTDVMEAWAGEPGLFVLRGHKAPLRRAAFSPDGTRIITVSADDSDDPTVRVWDASTGKPLASLEGHKRRTMAFSLDGTRIVTVLDDDSDDPTARVWDVSTGKPLATLEGHKQRVRAAAFSPDGTRVVTASEDTTARVWDASTGKLLASFEKHTDGVMAAAFSPDGTRIVTTSADDTARVWDASTGEALAVLEGRTKNLWAAAFSPDGTRIVAPFNEDTARVWDASTGKLLASLKGHTELVRAAAFSPDSTRVVTASADDTARVWDASTGEALAVLTGHNATVSAAAFSPDGTRIVTASADTTARMWDASTGKPLTSLKGHTGWVRAAAFSPDGIRIITAAYGDDAARVWDASTGKPLALLGGNKGRADAFSPEGTRIIVTASFDATARVWDASTGKPLSTLEGYKGWEVRAAAFSPDGTRIVIASEDKTVRVWDASTGKPLATLEGHQLPVMAAAFSPDGTRIVTASFDTTARVWDASTGKPLATLEGHQLPVSAAVFSPDGTRVVTASADTTARVWDASTGRSLAVLEGHKRRVPAAAFSPDGTRVVTASEDDTARVWDASTGKSLAVLEGHTRGVLAAAFSPDGTRIVTASADTTARVWPSWRWDPQAFSQLDIGRELSREERREFLHEP